MKLVLTLSGLFATCSLLSSIAQEPTKPPESLKEKASYVLGRDIVKDLRDRLVEFDLDQLLKGIRDAANDKPSVLTDEDTNSVMSTFGSELEKRQQARMRKIADKNMRDGLQFLKDNALKDGVRQLESGLQYTALVEGDGDQPKITDRVKVHFVGKTLAGKVFETTRNDKEPATLSVGGIALRGVIEALLRMKVGSKWLVVIPPELAYGVAGSPPDIEPNETLVIEIELLEIIK